MVVLFVVVGVFIFMVGCVVVEVWVFGRCGCCSSVLMWVCSFCGWNGLMRYLFVLEVRLRIIFDFLVRVESMMMNVLLIWWMCWVILKLLMLGRLMLSVVMIGWWVVIVVSFFGLELVRCILNFVVRNIFFSNECMLVLFLMIIVIRGWGLGVFMRFVCL